MSFIGNIVAGQAASAIGKYNQSVYSAQAAYQKRQGEIAKATYDKVTRPIFLKQQKLIHVQLFILKMSLWERI